ncbi:hypothetical protein [Phenylobacterium sp.]|jgi:hypothetical protein|uniref:hypothetical protein n=1 Tax=Phenylobacterium sp. TaxID=1871053 RepID=UPI002F930C1D
MSSAREFEQAYAAHVKGDLARAERGYRAIRLSMPFEANHNLGVVYVRMGRLAEAEQAFRAALAAAPEAAQPAYALGSLLLAEGRWAEGWPLYEARRGVPGLTRAAPDVGFPEWRGEELAGKRLLVLGEQGLGDNLMLARFLPQLTARGVEVVYACPRPLWPVMQDLRVALTDDESGVTADAWTLMFSLPLRLGVTPATLPPPAALSAPAPRTGGGVGVVPAGNPDHKNDAERSLGPREAARLLKLGQDLRPEATGARDFGDTAAIVAGLDLVITVDTSVAHLAGSLGKPVWILLPARETDWRWLRERQDSPWYPSARLFRQRVPGDWTAVFRRLETELKRLAPAP